MRTNTNNSPTIDQTAQTIKKSYKTNLKKRLIIAKNAICSKMITFEKNCKMRRLFIYSTLIILVSSIVFLTFKPRIKQIVPDGFLLKNYEALAESEGGSGGKIHCSCAGGEGASSCSCQSEIYNSGSGCSVTCSLGYFACCNLSILGDSCTCVKN